MYEFVIKGTPQEIMHEVNEIVFASFDKIREDAEQAERSELEHLAELDGIDLADMHNDNYYDR